MMIRAILEMAIEKAIKRNDPFVKTTCFKEICKYLGHKDLPDGAMISVYAYAKMRKRCYRTCKTLAAKYSLGTEFNGAKLLNETEVAFLDATRKSDDMTATARKRCKANPYARKLSDEELRGIRGDGK